MLLMASFLPSAFHFRLLGILWQDHDDGLSSELLNAVRVETARSK